MRTHNDTDLDSFDIDSANFTADPVVNSVAGPNVYAASVATAATGGTITIGTLPNADGNVTVTIDNTAYVAAVTAAGSDTTAKAATELATALNNLTAFSTTANLTATANNDKTISITKKAALYNEWYITSVGDTDWTMANGNGNTSYSAGNGQGQDVGGVSLQSAVEGTMFKAITLIH